MNTSLFTGTIEECVREFSRKVFGKCKTQSERSKLRTAVGGFLGINSLTAKRWFENGIKPGGENLLRLTYFLGLLGYEVVGSRYQQGSDDIISKLFEQVALRVVSLDTIGISLETDRDYVLSIVLGQGGTSSKRKEIIAEQVESRSAETVRMKSEWERSIRALGLKLPNVPTPKQEASSSAASSEHASLGNGVLVEMLAHLLLASVPLAEQILSDEYSPEQRKRLRDLTARGRSNAVFDLSNILNRLCGERARNELT